MAKQRLKVVRAGRLVREVLWTASFPSDTARARAEKQHFSSEARQRINDRYSWQKLKMMLAANFTYSDIVATLTFDDEHLPPNIVEARKRLKSFLASLRAYRRARGNELKYIYSIETVHGEGRIHFHVVLNGTGDDYELIRSLWIYGSNLEFSQVDAWGYEELAKYLTKEPREYGRIAVGARTWVCSANLAKPESPPAEWVDADVRLEAPPNAYVIRSESVRNEWGSFAYLEYMLAETPQQRRARPFHRKFQTDSSFSDLEQCILSGKGQQNNEDRIAR